MFEINADATAMNGLYDIFEAGHVDLFQVIFFDPHRVHKK
jgi:hypothetical protein